MICFITILYAYRKISGELTIIYSNASAIQEVGNIVRSEGSHTRNAISSLQGQIYAIKEVKRY